LEIHIKGVPGGEGPDRLARPQDAEAVVIIWTTDAILSPWVHFEVDYAAKNRTLINVEPEGIDRVHIP